MPGIGSWRGCAAFFLLLGALGWPGGAKAGDPAPTADGTCAGADFRTAWSGATELPATEDAYTTTVLRDGAGLYAGRTGNEQIRALRFNTRADVRAVDEERVGVALEGEREVAGWVRRSDLLCNSRPLLSAENKLERKAFVATLFALPDQRTQVVQALPAPEIATCVDSCRTLGLGTAYFIAAETRDAFLLADEFAFQSRRSVLTGWVSKRSVVEWNTALGLRSAEKPGDTRRSTTAFCAYLDLSDLRAGRTDKCQPISSGEGWFRTALRLLVLGATDEYYRAVDPLDGDRRQLFISAAADVEIDVWMPISTRDRLFEALRASLNDDASIAKHRVRLVNLLVRSLESQLGAPGFNDGQATLATYMRHSSRLPAHVRSPLLNYSVDDLVTWERVPECEVFSLLDWASASRQMLMIAAAGDKLAEVELMSPPGSCPLSAAGQKLRIPTSSVQVRPINGSTIWPLLDQAFYWMPHAYLP